MSGNRLKSKNGGTEFIENIDEIVRSRPSRHCALRHHVFVCSGKSCSAVGSAER